MSPYPEVTLTTVENSLRDTAPTFGRRLSGNWRVMTLEPGTCCYRAVSVFVDAAFEQPPELVLVSSFSEGIKNAAEPNDLVLLPHVHETCSALTTDPEWDQLVDLTFPYANPPLVLALRRSAGPEESPRCASIERLIPLSSRRDRGTFRFEIVNTTQEAARACVSASGPAFCITNRYGADRYGLEVVRVLKHMTIWWMPFRHIAMGEKHV